MVPYINTRRVLQPTRTRIPYTTYTTYAVNCYKARRKSHLPALSVLRFAQGDKESAVGGLRKKVAGSEHGCLVEREHAVTELNPSHARLNSRHAIPAATELRATGQRIASTASPTSKLPPSACSACASTGATAAALPAPVAVGCPPGLVALLHHGERLRLAAGAARRRERPRFGPQLAV